MFISDVVILHFFEIGCSHFAIWKNNFIKTIWEMKLFPIAVKEYNSINIILEPGFFLLVI
jgi:hypothetical protein